MVNKKEKFEASDEESEHWTVTFTCSICGQLRNERYNEDSSYCKSCQSSYVTWRGRRKRAHSPCSVADYRAYREIEGLPVIEEWRVTRGRKPKDDPNDLVKMPLKAATVAFLRLMREKYPEADFKMYVDCQDKDSGLSGTFEVEKFGWYEVDFLPRPDPFAGLKEYMAEHPDEFPER